MSSPGSQAMSPPMIPPEPTSLTGNSTAGGIGGVSPSQSPDIPGVRALARRYRMQLTATWSLFVVENILRLLQPLLLGMAIDDLLNNRFRGMLLLAAQHMAHLSVGTLRRMYDTRLFARAWSELASHVTRRERRRGAGLSTATARTTMVQDYFDFFEHTIPSVIRSAFSMGGGLLLLAWYDWRLLPCCLLLLLPASLLNAHYGGLIRRLSRSLHDRQERTVDVLATGGDERVGSHFREIALDRVRLSDAEALNFSLMELFVLALMIASLVLYCGSGADVTAGHVFAVFRYLMMFLMAVDTIPVVVAHLSRIGDIQRRICG